jgi:hypothetical protein
VTAAQGGNNEFQLVTYIAIMQLLTVLTDGSALNGAAVKSIMAIPLRI